MKWTTTSAIIGTVLLVTAFTLKLVGYEKAEAKEDVWLTINSNEPFEPKNDSLLTVTPAKGNLTLTTRNEPINLSEYIPTWPDYIELEKELVIEYEYDTGFVEYAGPGDSEFTIKTKKIMKTNQYNFPKGMKIYFKGDD